MLSEFKPLKIYFVQNRTALSLGLLSLLVVDFLQLFIPIVIKNSIDSLTFGKANYRLLFMYAMLIVGITFAIAIFRYIWRYLVIGHSRKVEKALRIRLYEHLQTLSVSFYWRTKTGDLMARAVNDIDAIRMAAGMGLVALTDGVVIGLATIGFMSYINLKLTLISIIPTPFIFYFTLIITRRVGKQFTQVQQTFSGLTESVREAFAGIRVIKSYNRQKWAYTRVENRGKEYVKNNIDLARTIALFFPMMTLFTNLGLAMVIWFGGRLAILGDITTGEFVAFISYLNLLTWPIMALGWVTNMIKRASSSMKRINEILNEAPEIANQTPNLSKGPITGLIQTRGLTFYYPKEKNPALKNINLVIEAGQTAAIVGKVGSGKSTLMHTIPRLVDTEKGMITIDGIPIHDMDLRHMRESIGFMTQETHIFSDTILNNIVFGRKGIKPEVIENAIEVSQLAGDIDSFPEGINTVLGEKGITMSGGQRQRLTIARALVSNPSILIMDDVLSQVDTRTEALILKNILLNRKGKTNIIVSHRLSTIRQAHIIYVLKAGNLVEKGNHSALMDKGKEYAGLYERQELSEELERKI
jgi:ATP-binding cassette subfamily B protein